MRSSKSPSTGSIVATNIHLKADSSGALLSCQLQTEGGDLPPTLWFHFPSHLAPLAAANADPFLPPLLLVSMKKRRRLVIEGDMSAALLSATPQIMRLYRKWTEKATYPLTAVEIVAGGVPRQPRGTATGVFFSCGVDSFYTVLKNLSRYHPGDPRLITHLLLVHGFDIPLERAGFFASVYQNAEAVANTLGKTLVTVRTNVRDVLRGLDWGRLAHGPSMASVGLALGNLWHTVLVPSSYDFSDGLEEPWGSHPCLDPLWSTEQVEFVHHGSEVKRICKTGFIATSPVALRHLRVCWDNSEDTYNCGRCEKCLRTMVDLRLCGALDKSEQFPKSVDPSALECLLIPESDLALWRSSLEYALARGTESALVKAIETALARSVVAQSRLGRLDSVLWAFLARMGLAPERMKSLDRRVFGGMGVMLFRKCQGRVARALSGLGDGSLHG